MALINNGEQVHKRSANSANKESSKMCKLDIGACSHPGYVREANEDRMDSLSTVFGDLFIVADGMGGYEGGARAATLTIETIKGYFQAQEIQPYCTCESVIEEAIQAANTAVYKERSLGKYAQMGSTVVLALITENVLRIAHVGDSRVYLYRHNKLWPLTQDHTLPMRMVKAGIITREDAEVHPKRHILDRAIGVSENVEIEIAEPVHLKLNDGVVLCSDGLCGYVSDAQIKQTITDVFNRQKPLPTNQVSASIAEELMHLALAHGGEDNVTVQYIRYIPRSLKRIWNRYFGYTAIAISLCFIVVFAFLEINNP